jgi:hypothetical protein
MPPKDDKPSKEEKRKKQEKENIKALESYDLTIVSNGDCEIVRAKEQPDCLSYIPIGYFIEAYRHRGDKEGLLRMLKQLEAIRDACDGAIGDIVGIDEFTGENEE